MTHPARTRRRDDGRTPSPSPARRSAAATRRRVGGGRLRGAPSLRSPPTPTRAPCTRRCRVRPDHRHRRAHAARQHLPPRPRRRRIPGMSRRRVCPPRDKSTLHASRTREGGLLLRGDECAPRTALRLACFEAEGLRRLHAVARGQWQVRPRIGRRRLTLRYTHSAPLGVSADLGKPRIGLGIWKGRLQGARTGPRSASRSSDSITQPQSATSQPPDVINAPLVASIWT